MSGSSAGIAQAIVYQLDIPSLFSRKCSRCDWVDHTEKGLAHVLGIEEAVCTKCIEHLQQASVRQRDSPKASLPAETKYENLFGTKGSATVNYPDWARGTVIVAPTQYEIKQAVDEYHTNCARALGYTAKWVQASAAQRAKWVGSPEYRAILTWLYYTGSGISFRDWLRIDNPMDNDSYTLEEAIASFEKIRCDWAKWAATCDSNIYQNLVQIFGNQGDITY